MALYDRTYRVLYDAGINEKLADELATHRTLAVSRHRDAPIRMALDRPERKCALTQAPSLKSSSRMMCSPNLWHREHYIAQRAAITASSIKDGRQATRVWNLFGTFQKVVNTLGLRTSRKSSNFQGVGWWAHQGSNLGPADLESAVLRTTRLRSDRVDPWARRIGRRTRFGRRGSFHDRLGRKQATRLSQKRLDFGRDQSVSAMTHGF